MKRLNIICAVIALIAVIICGNYVLRNYMNRDTTPPVINVGEDTIQCSIDADRQELLAGLTASDDKDGDLTDRIMVSNISICEDESGDSGEQRFDIDYIVFDSANNSASASRTLIYTDYHSPRFSISEKMRFSSISAVDLYSLISAQDCVDGNISSQITLQMDDAYLNAISYGVYTCTVSVTNSLGDTAEVPLSFEIYNATSEEEQTRPNINLTGYLTYVGRGSDFDPYSMLLDVVIDKIDYELVDSVEVWDSTTTPLYYGYTNANYGHFLPRDAVSVTGNVDTNTPGIYEVTYSIAHPEKGTVGSTNLTVVVQ